MQQRSLVLQHSIYNPFQLKGIFPTPLKLPAIIFCLKSIQLVLKNPTNKYGMKGTQVVKELKREKTINGIDIRKAHFYLKELFL